MSSARNYSRLLDLPRRLSVYARSRKSPLLFWYETPELNPRAWDSATNEYYMTFSQKARYAGPFDAAGVPLLNYMGRIGQQYNPIAISQYGLGNYNLYKQTGDAAHADKFLKAADWLVANLKPNTFGIPVWYHEFDWPYRELLKAPWYSGLAQGQGISLLVRASLVTGQERYGEAASAAFLALTKDIKEGGVTIVDSDGFFWIEEYLVDPPSHILNGFIWALWGVLDYARWRDDADARRVFERSVATIKENLAKYDTGYWSLYEWPVGKVSMVASSYYHRLHITQLRVMHKLTNQPVFLEYAERWENYGNNRSFRRKALLQKIQFKLTSY